MNRTNRFVALAALALSIGVLSRPVSAQELRDPTLAPGEVGAPAGRSPAGVDAMSVIVRDGRPFLVVGTRLYAPGDRFGSMRVERISETEVVLHDGNGRIRVPRFAGIERRTVVDSANCTRAKTAKPTKPTKRATAPMPARASSAALAKTPLPSNPPRARARPKSPPAAGTPCEDQPS